MTALTRFALSSLTLLTSTLITAPAVLVLPYGGRPGVVMFLAFACAASIGAACVSQWVVGLVTGPLRCRWAFPCAVGALWPTSLYLFFGNVLSVKKPDEAAFRLAYWATFGCFLTGLFGAAIMEIRTVLAMPAAWSVLLRWASAFLVLLLVGGLLLMTPDVGSDFLITLLCFTVATFSCSRDGERQGRTSLSKGRT